MPNESLIKQIEVEALPGIVSAVIAAVGSNVIFGNSYTQPIPVLGTRLPAYLVIGGTVAASHVVAELNKHLLLNKIPVLKDYKDLETRIIGPALAGLGTYAVFRLGISDTTNPINSIALGVGSSMAGKYISNTMLNMK